jgi:hypothetical protein
MIAQSARPPDAAASPGDGAPPSRYQSLAAATAAIRARRGGRVAVEQILLAAAAILFPLGLVLVLLGWEGASHTGRTYAQIDYLISGGILGLGLSVAGGFMYFGYWLSRQLSESRRQNALTLQALQRLEELFDASLTSQLSANGHGMLGRTVASQAGGPALTARPSAAARTSSRPRKGARRNPATEADATGEMPAAGAVLYATPRGSLLHRPECPVVARRTDLIAVAPGTEGYGYCTMCEAAEVVDR